MKANIDKSGCIGCGLCADICPGVFCMEDGTARVCGEVTADNEKEVNEAADSCPVSVITID